MNRRRFLLAALIVVTVISFIFPSLGEEAGFSFRNGISFGMSQQEIIGIEEANGEIPEDEWDTIAVNSWLHLHSNFPVQVGDFRTEIAYMLADDRMEMAYYEFPGYSGQGDPFTGLSAGLTEKYGEGHPVDPEEIEDFVSCFNPDYREQGNVIVTAFGWKKEHVTIYLFQYLYAPESSGKSTMLVYASPEFDYTQVNKPVPVNTTGL